MEGANEAPRHGTSLIAIISRRASNAANVMMRGNDSIDVDSHSLNTHHAHLPSSQSQQRRRGEREPAAWPTSNSHPRETNGPAPSIAATATPAVSTAGTLSNMLRRRRSGDVGGNTVVTAVSAQSTTANRRSFIGQPASSTANINASPITTPVCTGPPAKIRLVPHLENTRSLRFEAIARELKPGDPPLRIGRFTDRHNTSAGANRLAFKSKVVSRGHAEVWLDAGKFFIKDTKSSSGTFLNHQRLAPPSQESKPHALKDGDILQLGVDFQGGHEDIYKCVKIRVEIGREWQKASNAFNSEAMKTLRALSGTNTDPTIKGLTKKVKNSGDCCICLFGLQICQAIFIAPCSHSFHYKCIRPLLEQHHPGFTCPLCRTFADLTEDVEVEDEGEELDDEEAPNVDEPTPFMNGGTLNGREGPLASLATTGNVNALGIISNGTNVTVSSSQPLAVSSTVRNNNRRMSTGSVPQEDESDAEMYDREGSADRRGGDITDAEFSMPPRRNGTGMTVHEEENHYEHEHDDGMDVEQEAEMQAVRDGGRDHAESESPRNSEEIVMGVIGRYSDGDEPHWDRTFIPDDNAMPQVDESPRSSHESSSRNAISVPPIITSSNNAPSTRTIETRNMEVDESTANSHSRSQPNLLPSPRSPSIRSLIRVPSLTSPYMSTVNNRQKRRSLSRFGGALSENEGGSGGIRTSGFFGSFLGRKRGNSVSMGPTSPITTEVDEGGTSNGRADSPNQVTGAGVGEKRKR